jgi:hypothetical protein
VKKEWGIFRADDFIQHYARQGKRIESKHIALWIECSTRYVEKWAKDNDIKSERICGIKYYIWSEDAIKKFAEHINGKHAKEKTKERIDETGREEEIKNKLSGTVKIKTISDYAKGKSEKRLRQNWAKNHNVEYETRSGKKRYIWSEAVEERYCNRLYQEHRLRKNKKYGSLYVASCFTVAVGIETLRRWAKTHRLAYIENCKKYVCQKKDMVQYDLCCCGEIRRMSEERSAIDESLWRDIRDRRKAYVWDNQAVEAFVKEYIVI